VLLLLLCELLELCFVGMLSGCCCLRFMRLVANIIISKATDVMLATLDGLVSRLYADIRSESVSVAVVATSGETLHVVQAPLCRFLHAKKSVASAADGQTSSVKSCKSCSHGKRWWVVIPSHLSLSEDRRSV
jgi:hypothetical protein